MAQKEFILQGFSQRSHLDAIKEAFEVDDINLVLLSVSFIKETGVGQIEDVLRANGSHATVFAGIRNDITSYQALRRLYEIPELTLYTFDTADIHTTFHPKIYFVRGSSHARLVLGSANLTLGGLQNNVEAGLLVTFDLADPADGAVVNEIILQVGGMPQSHPENILNIASVDDLERLFDKGLITDEGDRPPLRTNRVAESPGQSTGQGAPRERVPRIRLRLSRLKSNLSGDRARPRNALLRETPGRRGGRRRPVNTPGVTPAAGPVPAVLSPRSGSQPQLVWQSKPLTKRDLNVPTGTRTNKTGSINLDKGLLEDVFDHRHYFREMVFSGLTWSPRKLTVDEAFANFDLSIKGVGYGEVRLPIRHTTSTTSAAYLQRNAMTRLSWGPMTQYIAQPDLIGLTMSLYRDAVDPGRFIIEID